MIKEKVKVLPHKPGCYLMKNINNEIIYVGKAKDLKNRVTTYFNGKQIGKTAIMVKNIADFDYIITSTEIESLVLELNLIKKYQPKYNILYRDDKTYPYIGITNEKIPRVKLYRSLYKQKENILLYGPYPNVMAARNIVELINRLYPLPKCRIMPKKKCLYYHLGQCLGYCEEDVDQSVIDNFVYEIKHFLAGDQKIIKERVQNELDFYNDNLAYEKASELIKYFEAMKIIFDKQNVELKQIIDADVIGYYVQDQIMVINFIFIRHGKIINVNSHLLQIIDDSEEEYFRFILDYYQKHQIRPALIISQINIHELEALIGVETRTPVRGDFKKLLDMAKDNAAEYLIKNKDKYNLRDEKVIKTWQKLSVALNISDLTRVEMIDNAHLFGSDAVSGLVVYDEGLKQTNLYRKYKIKYSQTNDDYAMMREVVYRRYHHLLISCERLPEALIVDGGIGQVNAALEIFNDLNLQVPIFGLVKNDKHQTKGLLSSDNKLIEVETDVFNFLTSMQNEVHRYTINFHEKTRNKKSLLSNLDEIPGIGPHRKSLLFTSFDNLTEMKQADLKKLQEILGNKAGSKLYDYWHSK